MHTHTHRVCGRELNMPPSVIDINIKDYKGHPSAHTQHISLAELNAPGEVLDVEFHFWKKCVNIKLKKNPKYIRKQNKQKTK